MEDIYIAGAGGFAREVAFLIEEINRVRETWRIIGFTEEDRANVGHRVGRYSIVGSHKDILDKDTSVVIGIGKPAVIARLSNLFRASGRLRFPNLIHPRVVWDKDRITIGEGNLICAGNVLTTDISIGSFNILNLSSTFGHDLVVGDCCVFNPGINVSGGVVVGHRVLVGTGAKVLQYLKLEMDSVVGSGAVVTKNVLSGDTVVGVPARPLAKK